MPMRKNNTNNGNLPNRRGHISKDYYLAVAGSLCKSLTGMKRRNVCYNAQYFTPEKGSQFHSGKHDSFLYPWTGGHGQRGCLCAWSGRKWEGRSPSLGPSSHSPLSLSPRWVPCEEHSVYIMGLQQPPHFLLGPRQPRRTQYQFIQSVK